MNSTNGFDSRSQAPMTVLGRRSRCALAATVMALAAGAAHADEVRVLVSEPIVIAETGAVSPQKYAQRVSGDRAKLRFSAYGRNFAMAIEAHPQLAKLAAARGASAIAFRGNLEGVAKSWVRLTQVGEDFHGLLFDGVELYAIEPARSIGNSAEAGSVIFRLRDTLTPAGTHTCAVDSTATTGAEYFKKMQTEIGAREDKADSVSHRLLLSAIFDTAFRQQYPSDQAATDALLARLNNVDGIFASQLGITIELTDLEPAGSSVAQRISSTTAANQLLTSLSHARSVDPSLLGTGITHLFTGRDLDGATIGISYIGAVCSSSYGATLSESRGRGAWIDSLIAAHEFGHSFGASHDGADDCAATPATYLMAPTIDGWDQFSQCSVNRIRAHIAHAACLQPIPKADVIVAETLGDQQAVVNQEFYWSVAIANLGQPVTQSVSVKISVPAAIQVLGANVTEGSCSVGGGIAECTLSAMSPQEIRQIELRMRGTLVGTYDVSVNAEADSDLDEDNNLGFGKLVITQAVASPPAPSPTATAPTPSAPSAEAGGGGGSFGWTLLWLGLLRRRISQRRG